MRGRRGGGVRYLEGWMGGMGGEIMEVAGLMGEFGGWEV